MPNQKAAFCILGCTLNLSETSTLAWIFKQDDDQEMNFKQTADFYAMNYF
jgi:tRNA A37 methylthiotransferase MiaB